jgi:nicotinate phosphoribosyltransferase
VEGIPTVKLSDNLRKSVGPVELVERYRRVFGTVAVGEHEVLV